MIDGKYSNGVLGFMVMDVFAEIRNGFEYFSKCNIFAFQLWVRKNSVVFWYLGMYVSIYSE